jgi:hypothetical protein
MGYLLSETRVARVYFYRQIPASNVHVIVRDPSRCDVYIYAPSADLQRQVAEALRYVCADPSHQSRPSCAVAAANQLAYSSFRARPLLDPPVVIASERQCRYATALFFFVAVLFRSLIAPSSIDVVQASSGTKKDRKWSGLTSFNERAPTPLPHVQSTRRMRRWRLVSTNTHGSEVQRCESTCSYAVLDFFG